MSHEKSRKKVVFAAAILLTLMFAGGVLIKRAGDSRDEGSKSATKPTESAAAPVPSSDTARTAQAPASPRGFAAGLKSKVMGMLGGDAGSSNDLGSAAPGSLAIQGGAPGSEIAMGKKESAIDISKNCFTESYTQKSNLSAEALANRRNLLRLQHYGVNPKSVCVRVNGTPVAHQLRAEGAKTDEILLGPVAAPTAKITVRYCMDKTTCNENCDVPKDEFLEAIGGVADADGAAGGKAVKWDPEEEGSEDDVTASLDPEVKRELAAHADLKVFTGWMSEGPEVSCGTRPLPKPVAATTAQAPNS